jgi:cation:H+ antiporter
MAVRRRCSRSSPPHRIERWKGGLFLAYYAAYVVYLVLDATAHDALPHFRDAMLFFALPLTAVTLLVLVTRTWAASR